MGNVLKKVNNGRLEISKKDKEGVQSFWLEGKEGKRCGKWRLVGDSAGCGTLRGDAERSQMGWSEHK